MPYSIDGDRYRLKCVACRTHIDTRIGRGRTAIADAVTRVRIQAEREGWTFEFGDRCPKHP